MLDQAVYAGGKPFNRRQCSGFCGDQPFLHLHQMVVADELSGAMELVIVQVLLDSMYALLKAPPKAPACPDYTNSIGKGFPCDRAFHVKPGFL